MTDYNMAAYAAMILAGDADMAFYQIHQHLLSLKAIADAPEAAADKVKLSDPLARFDKDEAGHDEAVMFIGTLAEQIIDWIDDDAARTYHFANVWSDRVGKFLSSELSYHRAQANGPKSKTATVSARADAKRTFNAVRKDVVALASIAASIDPGFSSAFVSDGKSILPGYVGAKPAGDAVYGRYAKVYALSWNVDGEDLDVKNLTDVVRYLWQGVDRIGKSAKDLGTLLDTVAPKWTDPKFETATFTTNGREVTITRTTED